MKIAYFDCFSGISGDMTLGALVDVGVPPETLTDGLATLKLDAEFSLRFEKAVKHSITGTRAIVDVHPAHTDPTKKKHIHTGIRIPIHTSIHTLITSMDRAATSPIFLSCLTIAIWIQPYGIPRNRSSIGSLRRRRRYTIHQKTTSTSTKSAASILLWTSSVLSSVSHIWR